MVDLSTKYLGITLKNPIIVGSSGLTSSAEKIKDLEKNGAGAVVLKSIFEEEISFEYADFIKTGATGYNDKYFDYEGRKNPIEYYDYILREENLRKYVDLIKESKKAVSIPVIASINCYFDSAEWIPYARIIEQAGADALELNMFFPPTDFSRTKKDKEELYFQLVKKIRENITIPISLKISYYFTDLALMIQKLSNTGINGLVLFNRFFSPDININKLEIVSSNVFSTPSELSVSLKWIAIMANKVGCDLAASTGVHDGEAVIKQILAGADVVQVVSCLYKNGPEYLEKLLERLESWMSARGYKNLSDFKGKLSQAKSTDPSIYDRVQFMRYYGGKKNLKIY
jgi:dihydroorotate dehydrogenase (fumarate)